MISINPADLKAKLPAMRPLSLVSLRNQAQIRRRELEEIYRNEELQRELNFITENITLITKEIRSRGME